MPSLWLIWMALSERDGTGFWVALLNDFLYHAKQAAVGFVIAGIVPLVLAVFKLVSIAAAGPPSADYPMGPRRPRMVPIVQGLFVLANAAASVLTLLKAIA
jgi:threonine/homoserine/homoserine lactone efflux protein